MYKSTNNFHSEQQATSHSTSFQQNNNMNQSQQQSSMLVSILSPRNLLKFFTKNQQKVQQTQTFRSPNKVQNQLINLNKDGCNNQFSKYTQSIKSQMQIYKNKRLKNRYKYSQKNQEIKDKQRQQIQYQIKINKIPQPYFRDWDNQIYINQLDLQTSTILTRQQPNLKDLKQTHKSLKLRSLLIIAQSKGKDNKKTKFRKKLLEEKQTQLEGYLDQVQLIIFSKTRKYPDHYLNYIANINNSDAQICQIQRKTKLCRTLIRQQFDRVSHKQLKVLQLQKKKTVIAQVLTYMNLIKQIHSFKKQSQHLSNKNKKPETNTATSNIEKKTSSQLIKLIHNHNLLNKLSCIKQTLLNIRDLDKKIKKSRLTNICDELKKNLEKNLNNIYSRDLWLKEKPPKDSILIDRMKSQIVNQIQAANEDNNVNNSFLNISVLDQSYIVTSHTQSVKKQINILFGGNSKQFKQLVKGWEQYCKLYNLNNHKLEQQQQIISQVFQRIVLRFAVKFEHDLEDYIAYIFTQNSINITQFPNIKTQLLYIQPKLFNKILNVLYQCLSTSLSFALVFKHLTSVCQKLIKIIIDKISGMFDRKSLNDYSAIQNKLVGYDDVTQILSSLDYWFEYVGSVSDQLQMQQQGGDDIVQQIVKFQQSLLKLKQKLIDQFLANVHKFALVSELKSSIEKEDFSIISIPVNSFIMLDFIINWGQQNQIQDKLGLGKINEVQQSFYFNSSILGDNKQSSKKIQSFSIFKVIDKKLIIQGKQFKVCYSVLILSLYLHIYLKIKKDFKELSTNVDERICQLIGFYIWYCKKLIFTPVHSQVSNVFHGQNPKATSNYKSINPNLSKKTILNLCMLANVCDLLTKFMDIFNITNKPKKVEKILCDLRAIKQDCFKQITMLPFLEVERQISCLYQSRLKTRKQVPTKQSIKIIELLDQARKELNLFINQNQIKKSLQNTVKIISKNYFGYLHNMEARGKAQLKWFLPQFKDIIGDIFPNDINNLQKQFRF